MPLIRPGTCAKAPRHPGVRTLRAAIAVLCARSLASAQETPRSPAESQPPARYSVGTAYDSARGRLVVFGGVGRGGYSGDTWEWDGSAWHRFAGPGPSPRNNPVMSWDAARRQVVMYSGDTRTAGALGDTWLFDGAQWREVKTPGPPPRSTAAMVYDSRRQRVVFFGGSAGSQMFGDTWEFDGERWTLAATEGPAPRTLHGLAFDQERGRVVLFGGTSVLAPDAPSHGDTWEWDGARWQRIEVEGPSARDHVAMAYDPVLRAVVLHGGGLGPVDPSETWGWNGRAWTRVSSDGPRRRYARLAFDARSRAMLLYGGFDTQPSNELWRLAGTRWTRVPPPDPGADRPAAPSSRHGESQPHVEPNSSLQRRTYAFVDVNVIPMDGEGVLEHQTVIVRDGRVLSIRPAGAAIPAGATLIAGSGKYLIPGFGDAHAHLSTAGGGTALAERALPLLALHGVTMVRSMYTEPHHRSARERVERGELVGPRTVIVSPALHGGNSPTPQAARDSARSFKAAGYPFLKVLGGLSREVFDTLAAEARRLQLPLAGHVPATVPLGVALASGYESVEHLDGFMEAMVDTGAGPGATGFFGLGLLSAIDEQRIAAIVQAVKRAGTTIVPTEFEMELFVGMDSASALATRSEMRYVPRPLLEQWTRQRGNFARNANVTPERAERYRAVRRRLIRELHDAGVPIAVGSDAFNMFDVPGAGVFHEMETLVAAGMTTHVVLCSATVEVAKLLHLEGVTGTIAEGSVADLVLLDANPLSNITNARRQAGVMLRGAWYAKDEIDRLLNNLATDRP